MLTQVGRLAGGDRVGPRFHRQRWRQSSKELARTGLHSLVLPAFGWQLTDAQIAAVTTFIRNSWGHAAPGLTPGEVHKARSLSSNGG
jgi:mono/diheme cytochrome c family protein